MLKKNRLGQFYSTKADYLFQGLFLETNIKKIIEPFAGDLHLGKYLEPFLTENPHIGIEYYDLIPKHSNIQARDTLLCPPDYSKAWVVTNPPFLARNKNTEKTYYQKYNQNDLYKCFLISLIEGNCLGALLIIPLNFWCSSRQIDVSMRQTFLQHYTVEKLNIFEEAVFDDTSYTVCSFKCIKKPIPSSISQTIPTMVYPSQKKLSLVLQSTPIIGLDIYHLPTSTKHRISRAISKNKDSPGLTNIVIKCIDDNRESRICAKIVENKDRYIDETIGSKRRSYLTLVIEPPISLCQQNKLVSSFNDTLEKYRDLYHSLFLTNYRESKDIARKRISFRLVFKICGFLITLL